MYVFFFVVHNIHYATDDDGTTQHASSPMLSVCSGRSELLCETAKDAIF